MARSTSGSSQIISSTLITEAQRGHVTTLVEAIRGLLLRALATRGVPAAVAEELAQDRVLRLLARFCAGTAAGCWDAYARRTANRLACRYHKTRTREISAGDDVPELQDERPSAEELLSRGEQQAHLRAALAKLPASDRNLLERHYFDDVPLPVFMTGVSAAAIYKRHERAKARLRAAVMEVMGEA